jgi:hypothetical protein
MWNQHKWSITWAHGLWTISFQDWTLGLRNLWHCFCQQNFFFLLPSVLFGQGDQLFYFNSFLVVFSYDAGCRLHKYSMWIIAYFSPLNSFSVRSRLGRVQNDVAKMRVPGRPCRVWVIPVFQQYPRTVLPSILILRNYCLHAFQHRLHALWQAIRVYLPDLGVIFVFFGADILVVFIICWKCWNYENDGCFL